jgi:serine/threonine protein kinase
VTTKDRQACAICGTPIPSDSTFCPVCALRGALDSETAIAESSLKPTSSTSRLRFEHYEILTRENGTPLELGRGAMGITYKAVDVNLRRVVALKVINAKFVGNELANRRLVREARAAASVRHPNVASVFHLGKSDDSFFYAMEFVDGESLDKVLGRSGRLDPSAALNVTALVASGLEAIDRQGLVHRDIKPSNIMLGLEARSVANAKIIDLGLAKGTVTDNGSISEISTEGGFAGTPQYASPEQFAGIGADIRSDLYSLGITLWEMLAGEVPFHGSASELIYQHQHAALPVDKLAHVPSTVVALLEVLLEKDPARRFQTPTQLLEAIPRVADALQAGASITPDQLRSGADEIPTPAKRPKQRLHRSLAGNRTRAFGWLLASIVGIAGLLLAWFFFSGNGRRFFNQRGAETVPAEKSIAVLPFENISASKEDAYFADGVQDEILNNLAKIAQLKVISRTSVMQFRADTKRDLRQIANALGVGHVLEGTVRRDGNRVRVSTELIDASNDHTIWADSYDRDLSDIFAIQSEVAQTIANKLTATLSPEEKKQIEARPTQNVEAYDLYLQATELIANARVVSFISDIEKPLRDAVHLLDQAVRLDPKFALAYCAATNAHDWLYSLYDRTPERKVLGDAAIENALGLQPSLPEVHLAYAFHLYKTQGDYERARVQVAIAKQSMPNNTEALQLEAYIDRRQGNFEKAVQEFKEAIARDPRDLLPIRELAGLLSGLRQFSAAKQAYDRAIELAPNQPMLKLLKAFVSFYETGVDTPVRAAVADLPESMARDRSILCLHLSLALSDRDWQKARDLVEQLKGGQDEGDFGYAGSQVPVNCYLILMARIQGEPPSADASFIETREELNQGAQNSPTVAPLVSTLALVDALLGRKEEAIAGAKRAVEMLPVYRDAVDGPGILTNLALVYAWTGESDLAIATLAPLTKMPNGLFYGPLIRDPIWDPLRQDPRFEKLLAELVPPDTGSSQ